MDFIQGDDFVQETGIGFHGGKFFKSAVICERTKGAPVGEKRQKVDEKNTEMQEETKEEVDPKPVTD